MPENSQHRDDFSVNDCALITLSTGVNAMNLRELREGLLTVEDTSIYHHIWGRLMQPQFTEPEYNNDFASWAHRALHDKALAERLSAIDPTGLESIDLLREEIVDIVEMRLDESELVPWTRADNKFCFIRSQIVVFDTGIRVRQPEDFVELLPNLTTGSIFYHFIDARRRTEEKMDDFYSWLLGYKDQYIDLLEDLKTVDPYFSSLRELQGIVSDMFEQHLGSRKS